MADESPTASRERRCSGPPNAEILGPVVHEYLPTLDDIGYPESSKYWKRFSKVFDKLPDTPAAWRDSQEFADTRWLTKVEGDLPPPSHEDHSVYLVTVPHRSLRHSFRHWPFYSQGYFFHLTAPNKRHDNVAKRKSKPSGPPARQIQVGLKVQNLVNPDETEFTTLTQKAQRTALIAYQVGHTRFSPPQLRLLANYSIGALATYDFYERNCHSFVLSMLYRTVMTQKDCSVFVGNMQQIVDWDLRGKTSNERFYSSDTGYMLAAPQSTVVPRNFFSKMWQIWPLESWKSISRVDSARAIAALYRHGDLAIGAFDPSGTRGSLRYAAHVFYQDMKSVTSPQLAEMREDLVHRRWRNLLIGRPDCRKRDYMRKEEKARRGDTLEKRLLGFHRWCLRVTEEERRAWVEEANLATESTPVQPQDL